MLGKQKHVIEKNLKPILVLFTKVNPTILTIIGSIPPLLFFVFVIYTYYNFALLVFPFLALDLFDGALARMSGRVTAFGGFLDSTIDRISDFLLISAFGFGKIVRWEIVVIFLFSSFLVSYVRSRGELASNKTVTFNIGALERTERLLGMLACLAGYIFAPYLRLWGFNIAEVFFILLILLSFITFVQRVIYAYKEL